MLNLLVNHKVDLAAAVLLWTGNFILVKKSYWAFVIFMIANSLWAVYWFKRQEWVALGLVLSFLLQNVYGLISWRRASKLQEIVIK